MASNQKWRSYGGLNHFDSNNSVSFNNLTVGNLSIKNEYIGRFAIQGPLTVSDYASIFGNVRIGGNTLIYGQTDVLGASSFSDNVSIAGDVVIGRSLTINGKINIGYGFVFDNDIKVNGNIGMTGKYIYMGPDNSIFNYGKLVCNTYTDAKFMGVNQPVENELIYPGSTFEIYCDTLNNNINSFHAHSNSTNPAQSVIVSNSNYQGTVFYTDPSKNSIYLFNKHPIPTDDKSKQDEYKYTKVEIITPTNCYPDCEITHDYDGNLLILVDNNTFLSSKVIVGKSSTKNFIDSNLHEKMTIYTDPSNANLFNYTYYETSGNYVTNNGLTIINDSSFNQSNAGLNLVTNNTLSGMNLCGGTYILDTTKSMGSIGLNEDGSGNFIPVQTMVTGNNQAYRRTSTGINTYAPIMDNYTLNINGKTLISEGEIVKIQDLSFQLHGLTACARSPNYIIGYGSPNVITIPDASNHIHPFVYTKNGGQSWSIGDISGSFSNEIHNYLISANYSFSYDSSYSFVVYEGQNNWYYTSNGGSIWRKMSISTNVINIKNATSIRVLDMSNSVMMAFTVTDSTTDVNYMFYGNMSSISNINSYCPDDSSYSSLSTTSFQIPSGTITGMDSYDSSYIFITGSFGIYKYSVNNGLGTINSTPVNTKTDHSYNSLCTYKTYTNGVLNSDPFFSIFVGNNCITTTYDGGATFNTKDISANLQSVYIYDINRSIAIGTYNNAGVIYVTWNGGSTWTNMSSNYLFTSSGVSNILFGNNKNLASICIPSLDNFLISRIDSTYVQNTIDTSGILGSSKIYHCHFPNLFNIENHTVLDICGSIFVDGYINTSKNLNIEGSINITSGNVLINQNGGDSYNANSGVLVIPNKCGAAISGNVTVGGNLVCGNIINTGNLNISSSTGIVNIGSSSGLFPSITQNVNIGSLVNSTTRDNIYIYGNSLHIDVSNLDIVNINSINTFYANSSYVSLKYTTVNGSGMDFYDVSYVNPIGGFNITQDGSGFIFWPIYSKKIRLDAYNFSLGSGINNSIVSLKASPYNDSSYVICNQSNIDISNLVLTTGVNAVNNIQTIGTDVSVNGNLFVSKGLTVVDGVGAGIIKISNSFADSYSTNSGSLQLNGGLGMSGNIYTGGNVRILSTTGTTNTGSGALVVGGGVGIGGNLYLGKELTVDGSYAYFASDVYINCKNGLGPTHLSMTDFSSNATFYSTTESLSTGSGSVVISGGVGVAGNINMGGNLAINGALFANKDANFNGNVNVTSGNLYVGNSIYFGPGSTHLSMTDFSSNVIFHSTTESFGTGSGSIVVSGGAGIAGNVCVGKSIYFGSGLTHLSMTDFSSNVVFHSTTESIGTDSGAIVVGGGLGISGNAYVGNSIYFGAGSTHLSMTDFSSNVVFHSTNQSISTGTGGVVVTGGVGIGGNLYLGGNLNIDGSYAYFASDVYINNKNGLGPTHLSMTDFSSNVVFHSTTESIGTDSGAIVVNGGAGIAGNVYVGNSIYFGAGLTHLSMTDFSSNVVFHSIAESTGTGSGSVVVNGGIGIGGNLYLGGNLNVDGSYAYFANDVFINNKNGLGPTHLSMTDFSSNVLFHSTTESVSTASGSVTVSGGLGIAGNLHIGGNLFVDGSNAFFADKIYVNSKTSPTLLSMTDFYNDTVFHTSTQSVDISSGSIIVNGGIGIGGNVNVGKYMKINGTVDSTSISSGSLIVSGGVGIGGNVYAKAYYGGTNNSSNIVNFGSTFCHYLQSMSKIDVSNGLNIYGGTPGSYSGGSLFLSGTSGLYSGGSVYIADTSACIGPTSGALIVVGGASIGGNLYVAGNVTTTAVNYISDYRVKKHVEILDDKYTVDDLQPIKYHNELTDRDEIGFLAHQVQEIYPYLVQGPKDGKNYQSLNYIGIIGILVKEIKELKRKMRELEC